MNRISEEYFFNELSSLRSQLECWPALPVPRPGRDREARLAWNTMLSLQYLGSRSHKIQPLQARSGPGNTGKMEYWVLGNWDFGLLEKFILTWEGICQKTRILL